jgi:SsrA-binding protein
MAKAQVQPKYAAENRKARFDYHITDTLEAGIMLTGTEIKALRLGRASITDSYASHEDGGVWLINAYIPEYLYDAHSAQHSL